MAGISSCVERGDCFRGESAGFTSDGGRMILLSFICCQKGEFSVIHFRVILLTPKNDLIYTFDQLAFPVLIKAEA